MPVSFVGKFVSKILFRSQRQTLCHQLRGVSPPADTKGTGGAPATETSKLGRGFTTFGLASHAAWHVQPPILALDKGDRQYRTNQEYLFYMVIRKFIATILPLALIGAGIWLVFAAKQMRATKRLASSR